MIRSLVVFRVGALGDTLVSLPVFALLRRKLPNTRIYLLADQPRTDVVDPESILKPIGLIDECLRYGADGGRASYLDLSRRLRDLRPEALLYLMPTSRGILRLLRDVSFFRASGVGKLYGAIRHKERTAKVGGDFSRPVQAEGDRLLQVLFDSGLIEGCAPEDVASIDIPENFETNWRAKFPDLATESRPLLAVGHGSKMPAKRWPLDRFAELIERVLESRDILPVVFGSPDEAADGQRLIDRWGRGVLVAGKLDIPEALALIRHAQAYVGNDTGTMHMAALMGVPCVSLFSSRDLPGKWFPQGAGHISLRTSIPCQGCMLTECVEKDLACLKRIAVDDAFESLQRVWKS